MTSPALTDEYPISSVPDVPLWSENYFLAACDVARGVGVLYSVGRWPTEPSVWRDLVGVHLPDGRVLFMRGYGRHASSTIASAGSAALEIVEPGRELRLRADGPMWLTDREALFADEHRLQPPVHGRVDLTFTSGNPLWDMHGGGGQAAGMAGAMHVEQVGRVDGSIRVGAEEFPVEDAFAIRDHSRGPRDVGPYKGHLWFSGRFPGGRALHVYAMHAQDGRTMAKAAVIDGDRCHEAEVVEHRFATGVDEAREPHAVGVRSELGLMRVTATRVVTSFPLSFVSPFDSTLGRYADRPHALVLESGLQLDWDGVSGIGWSERGFTEEPLA